MTIWVTGGSIWTCYLTCWRWILRSTSCARLERWVVRIPPTLNLSLCDLLFLPASTDRTPSPSSPPPSPFLKMAETQRVELFHAFSLNVSNISTLLLHNPYTRFFRLLLFVPAVKCKQGNASCFADAFFSCRWQVGCEGRNWQRISPGFRKSHKRCSSLQVLESTVHQFFDVGVSSPGYGSLQGDSGCIAAVLGGGEDHGWGVLGRHLSHAADSTCTGSL